ncbi:MAG: M23 family metallopeptidase [Desulfobacterales bacterium]|nr:M23 family metallopeptidase [Desulfobacterales bacterium]
MIGILAVMGVLPVVVLALMRLEGEPPRLELLPEPVAIGMTMPVSATVVDERSGVRRVWVGLYKDGKETVLFEKTYPGSVLLGSGTQKKVTFAFTVTPKELGIIDGPAVFRVRVRDFSWRGWFNGNKTEMERDVVVDTREPVIDVVSRAHYFTQGGAGAVIYRLSEPCPRSGVTVGEDFYPGYSGLFKDQTLYLAMMALNHRQGPGTSIAVQATDAAGNTGRAGFRHWIKSRRFRADRINISDGFLDWKMPEFQEDITVDAQTPIDKFLQVNRKVRADNYLTLKSRILNPERRLLWEGAFLRLPNAANRAGFADSREYRYNGKIIDHQVHMGIDLASLAHSPVPAANAGKVAFNENLGIYGRTVILDHGFGLFTMYAHLSSIDVTKGQMVSKGGIIGLTGTTGMAGGDHLHFAVMVHHTFVNPIEWWDGTWIQNNISAKIEQAQTPGG